jgi:hypothetical protein
MVPYSTPLAYVRLLKGYEVWQWGVGCCPFCREAHLHSATFLHSSQHPREALTWRVARCRKGSVSAAVRDQGYRLVELSEDRAETDHILSEYAEAKAKAKVKA